MFDDVVNPLFVDLEREQAFGTNGCFDFILVDKFGGPAEVTVLTHSCGVKDGDRLAALALDCAAIC